MNCRSVARVLVAASMFLTFTIFPNDTRGQSVSTPDPHEAQPERPTVATHAGTVAPGWVEFEAGTEFDRYAARSWGWSVPVLSKSGIAPRVQLNIQAPVVRPVGNATAGVGDVALGVKWRVVEGAPILGNFAILPSLKYPSGSTSSGTGTGTTDWSLLVISSHDLGPIAMDVNAGYTRRSGNGNAAPRNATVWTTSFGGPAHGRLGWVAELYGYLGTSGPSGSPPIEAFLSGPTIQLRKSLVLDAGYIAPIAGPQPRAVYAGVVYNVGRVHR